MFFLRKLVYSCGLMMLTIFLHAQYKVTFNVQVAPDHTPSNGSIYIAGSFNDWNPGSNQYKLKKIKGKTGITIEIPKGKIEYKFTLGSWNKVEVKQNGSPIQNRMTNVQADTTINVEIERWAEHTSTPERVSTANKNVHIMDSSFFMPQLNRHRRIWIYLPESYAVSKKRYPVLYLQDGQNVFDEATSFSGEWGVDEFLDSLDNQNRECIVIAIDNGGDKRINEYCPYDMEKYGKGEGDLYAAFLVKTLKPYVDQHFRTKRTKENTFIAGSSLGGLISLYALIKYNRVFGGAGVFSPAFWIAPNLKNYVEKQGKKVKGKIYFYAGEAESDSMVPDMMAVYEKLQAFSSAKMISVLSKEGKHSESDWRKEFPGFYKWMIH